MSELRWNPLLGTWTIVASHRQKRPEMPKNWCPFCPGSGKVPDNYVVYKFDNDFPALSGSPMEPDPVGSELYQTEEAYGKCEVILYSPNHTTTLNQLSVDHITKLVNLWCERVEELYQDPKVKYVMPFENKGPEVGVTMPHPHGQIYAYSWVPLKVKTELDQAKKYYDENHKCLICQMNQDEIEFKERIIYENDSFIAYLPFFTDYPYGAFIVSKQHKGYIYEFNDSERKDLAEILKIVTGAFDHIFHRPFPYMMVMHQRSMNDDDYQDKDYFHFHIEFYPPLRGKYSIKYYASSETGGWAAANVAAVESTAKIMRKSMLEFVKNWDLNKFKEMFEKEFFRFYGNEKDKPQIFQAPARVNLIGEHIDYNGGKVFPAAIDKHICMAIRKRNDHKAVYRDLSFSEVYEIDLNNELKYDENGSWANYLNGILHVLKNKGYVISSGFEVLFFSEIPAGGGVSSSAALELAFTSGISGLFDFDLDPVEMAVVARESEHTFVGVQCGIMDQFSVAMGKEDHAVLLDTKTLDYEYAPLKLGEYRIVIMNSGKKRKLSESKYNERLEECQKGLNIIQNEKNIQNLCDLSSSDLESVSDLIKDETIQKRVRHAVTENERVLQSLDALNNNDLIRFGELMKESHLSLKKDYEVTGIELDTLFEEACAFEGCIGARMTGAGFGGCAVALVKEDKIDEFSEKVAQSYREKTGLIPDFFSCKASDGVKEI